MKKLTNSIKRTMNPMSNPIIVKELRSRMRGARAFITLTAALMLMALMSYGIYKLVIVTSTWSYTPLSPQIGQTLFMALAVLEMMMICLITPAITAGAISGEHEKLTYEMLLTTPLKPTRILWGKLISALSYIILLIFAAIPMASLVFIYGGVSPRDMIKALIVLFCTAIMLGTIGIFTSTWLKRSGRATVVSYLIVLALLGAPTVIYGIVGVVRQAEPPRWLLVPSPMSALFSAISPSSTLGGNSLSLIGGLSMLMAGNLNFISTDSIPRPLYHYTLPLYGFVTLILYLLSTRFIRPARRWRLKFKDIMVGAVSILILIGTVSLAFASTTDRYENISIFAVPTPFMGPMPVEPFVQQAVAVQVIEGPPVADEEVVAAYHAILQNLDELDVVADSQVAISQWIYPDPSAPQNFIPENTYSLSGETLTGISASAEDLSFEIDWVGTYSDFIEEAGADPVDEKPLILFGNLNPTKTNFLQVFITIYYPDQTHQNLVINLDHSSGDWEVINTEVFEIEANYPEPSSNSPSYPGPEEGLGELTFSNEEMSEIFAAVILQAYVDDTPLPGIDIPQMFIVQNTVLGTEPEEIPAAVRTNLEKRFESLPFEIIWIDSREQISLDNVTGEVEGGGGLIELGNIQPQENGSINVIINLQYSEEAKVLITYILENVPDGGWQIVEYGGHG